MGTHLGYRPQLDGLRALAIGSVLIFHASEAFGVPAVLPGGFLGVDLFFVLSGFLITRLLVDRFADGEHWPRKFYWRRARRLLPPLAVVLPVTIILVAIVDPAMLRRTWYEVAATATYVANYHWFAGHLAHTWSLAIEEQFYLLWPPLLLWALRRRVAPRQIVAGLVVAVLVVAVWRLWLHADTGNWRLAHYRTDTRADTLLVGCILAMIWPSVARWRWAGGMALAALAALAVMTHPSDPGMYRGGFTVVAVLGAVTVAAGAAGRLPWLENHRLVTVGRMSYALYLWHYPIFSLLRSPDGQFAADRLIVAVAASWTAAWISWRLVERRVVQRPDPRPALVHATE